MEIYLCDKFNIQFDLNKLDQNKGICFGWDGKSYIQHLNLKEMIQNGYISEEQSAACFKFAFIRNPFERLVSAFFHNQSHVNNFSDLVNHISDWENVNTHFLPQINFTEGVDFIGRYENLEKDFAQVCDRIGIECTGLPNINTRKNRGQETAQDYRQYYSANLRSIVEEYYKKDLETFGYEF